MQSLRTSYSVHHSSFEHQTWEKCHSARVNQTETACCAIEEGSKFLITGTFQKRKFVTELNIGGQSWPTKRGFKTNKS